MIELGIMRFGKSRDPDFSKFDTVIAERTTIAGSLDYAGSLHVHGKIANGNVKMLGDSTVPRVLVVTGHVTGSVEADFAFINGVIEGDLTVTQLLRLGKRARVFGSIKYGDLVVERGALLNGTLERTTLNSDAPKLSHWQGFLNVLGCFT